MVCDIYLEELDPEQRQSVEHCGCSLFILAGPGSGKTRVVTAKVAYLIRELKVNPESILACTFTKMLLERWQNVLS